LADSFVAVATGRTCQASKYGFDAPPYQNENENPRADKEDGPVGQLQSVDSHFYFAWQLNTLISFRFESDAQAST
tara:strand:+ start:84 stop:308 length:225 start_codon:yes stop_codon:yes gene_type:complete